MSVNLDRFRWTEEEWEDVLNQALDRVKPKSGAVTELITAAELAEDAEKLLATAGKVIGLRTGYNSIDNMTRGMAPGDLIIIYGDTSHGKSQLAQNISYNIAKTDTPVMFIGLEMTNVQNTSRFLQIGNNDPDRNAALTHVLYPKTNDLRYENVESHIKAAKREGAELVVIDQLQQLTRDPGNVTNETSLITHEVKRMAVRFEVPIILISHINRTGNRTGAPTLSELKGSSSIEQDADICLSVWRDFDTRNNALNQLQVWQRKNRNRGGMGMNTILNVTDEVRLVEPVTLGVDGIFPGAKYVD